MAIVDDLNNIRDWIQTEVCEKVKLKVPDDETNADGYSYELVTPSAFVLFTPSKDRLPPDVRAPIPSVCIRLSEGEHNPQTCINTMRIVLNFCTWNPGIHTKDTFIPVDGSGWQGYNQAAEAEYQRSTDGWQDVYNFIDVALRKIESADYIAGMRVVAENGIQYGMTSGQDGTDDFYPYWPAWISFSLQAGNVRDKSINQLL